MLFFRSEEHARLWCDQRGTAVNPLVDMQRLWILAQVWYSTRLQPDARRPQPDEARDVFDGLGLTGAFWDLSTDAFG